jgi:hypothetical protein
MTGGMFGIENSEFDLDGSRWKDPLPKKNEMVLNEKGGERHRTATATRSGTA